MLFRQQGHRCSGCLLSGQFMECYQTVNRVIEKDQWNKSSRNQSATQPSHCNQEFRANIKTDIKLNRYNEGVRGTRAGAVGHALPFRIVGCETCSVDVATCFDIHLEG